MLLVIRNKYHMCIYMCEKIHNYIYMCKNNNICIHMHIVCAYSISNSLGLSVDHFQSLYKYIYKSAQYTCSYYTYKYKYNTQMQEEQIQIQECISSVYLSSWYLSEGMQGQDHFTKMFLQRH